jgi:hypothetical protein
VPGGLIRLEMDHVRHEPDRVLDRVEPAVLVEPRVLLVANSSRIQARKASTSAVGDLSRSTLVMASTPTAERS